MAQHQVPQFIEVEDKIFGPLTFRQFIYILGSAGFAFMAFRLLPFFFAFIVGAPVVALGLALAFYKVNNKPFILTLEAAFKYVIGSKLYIWRKEPKERKKLKEIQEESVSMNIPRLSNSKLEDLSWGLDIKEQEEE